MYHHFDIDIAKEYGILEAVILESIRFWIEKNKANEKNIYDGRAWTYNSIKAYLKLFPYASEGQIRRALKNLEGKGLLITGNYNKSAYDRTTWYALTDFAESIFQNQNYHFSNLENGNCENDTPIPDKYPDDCNTGEKPCKGQGEQSHPPIPYSEIKNLYNTICLSFSELKTMSDSRKKAIAARIRSGYTLDDFKTMFEKAEASSFLKGQNARNWVAHFDWMIKDANMAKIIDGNYDDRTPVKSGFPDYSCGEDESL